MALIGRFPKGFEKEQLTEWLLKNYPITDIAETCAYYLLNHSPKIPITRQQFVDFFKIIGEREDGTAETRGRRPIEKVLNISNGSKTQFNKG